MTLRSMTAFARGEGGHEDVAWIWEIRSVNGKNLDVRLRLPHGFDRLEQAIRKACVQVLKRGNLQISLSLEGGATDTVPTVNRRALAAVLDAVAHVEKNAEVAPSTAAEILGLRGVLETAGGTQSEDDQNALEAALLGGFDDALEGLVEQRETEGKALAGFLESQVARIEELATAAAKDPSAATEAVLDRLATQVEQLIGDNSTLDSARLHQEAALLATKADIREELDRLGAHIIAARALIDDGSPAGRKLEFLSQEFNRECNTLCAKAGTVSLSQTGLEMKAVIDQFREQCLNVE